MTNQDNTGPMHEKHITAYNRMLQRVKSFIDEAQKEFTPKIQYGIAAAMDKATELGELSREEAEKIGDYLQRDLVDAAQHLSDSEEELSSWLRFDIKLIEARLAEQFALMVDHTRLELEHLAERAQQENVWYSGEITGIGSLRCRSCDEQIHFHETGHIPPCPKCHNTSFQRLTK